MGYILLVFSLATVVSFLISMIKIAEALARMASAQEEIATKLAQDQPTENDNQSTNDA